MVDRAVPPKERGTFLRMCDRSGVRSVNLYVPFMTRKDFLINHKRQGEKHIERLNQSVLAAAAAQPVHISLLLVTHVVYES